LQEVVEEVIEFNSEVISYEDDVVAQLYFVESDTLRYLLSNLILAIADFPEGLLDLRLERLGEVEILKRVERDHRMQEMCRL
jgi:hypothetical protein